MTDLAAQRRYYAEELQISSNLRSPALVEALATIPRERFLPAGPWTIRGDADFQSPLRQTASDDPRHVYHNVAIAIDARRLLFNGAPGLLAMAIDALALEEGARVLHVGTGTGYYTALLAQSVGARGRVLGFEVDAALARAAAENLTSMPWVEIRHADATGVLDEPFDAILVNAGVTHPQGTWLEALAPGGRLLVPVTATMPAMTTIGKGLLLLVTRGDDVDRWPARLVTFVAIYSAIGLRNDDLNRRLGEALRASPFPPVKHLRRDAHEATASCWLHTPAGCLSMA